MAALQAHGVWLSIHQPFIIDTALTSALAVRASHGYIFNYGMITLLWLLNRWFLRTGLCCRKSTCKKFCPEFRHWSPAETCFSWFAETTSWGSSVHAPSSRTPGAASSLASNCSSAIPKSASSASMPKLTLRVSSLRGKTHSSPVQSYAKHHVSCPTNIPPFWWDLLVWRVLRTEWV